MGDHWLNRVKKHAAEAGKQTIVDEQPRLNSVCGVGGFRMQSGQEPQYQLESQNWGTSRSWGSVLDNSD
eukprot:1292396-Prorocentrum_lima.AAC.1